MHSREESSVSATSSATAFDDIELRSRESISRDDMSEKTAIYSPGSDLSSPSTPDLKVLDAELEGAFLSENAEQERLLELPPIDEKIDSKPLIARVSKKEQGRPSKQIASWRELPKKGQIALLICSRLSEPLTMTSVQSYRFYQLQWFDPTLSESAIASQIGWLAAAFTVAQFCTAFAWGRASDSEWLGRKRVLLIGLMGTMIASMGFGFSTSFAQAVTFTCIGGALNGNVGVMRVMISEIIKEKRFQSRAFMLLPMTFNIGVIIGPMMGGWLADPLKSYPSLVGPGSWLGGEEGVDWMHRFPYALPNLMCAIFLLSSSLALFLGLDETHEVLKYRRDRGRDLGRWIARTIFRRRDHTAYTAISRADYLDKDPSDIELQSKTPKPVIRQRLPFRRMFTRNVVITLASHFLLASHVGSFNNLWFTLLSTARFDPKTAESPSHQTQSFPFHFTGGLAMPPSTIGLALSILGGIGIILQLFVYPRLSSKFGAAKSYRMFIFLFPIAYSLAPYLVLVPSTSAPPAQASGPLIWISITGILFVQVSTLR